MKYLCIVLLSITCGFAKLPHYIKPCSRNDLNFNACALKHANENIKELVKGDREHDIQPLDPLKVEKLTIVANNLVIIDRNMEVRGFKDLVITNLTYDFKTQSYRITFITPNLNMQSDYEVSGKILILPITGKGRVNCTLINLETDVQGTIVLKSINGTKYIYTDKPKIDMKVTRMYLRFSNLFNGNKLLEDEMNDFLDTNWKDVYNELSKPGIDATGSILLEIINKIHRTAPYDELFPETLP